MPPVNAIHGIPLYSKTDTSQHAINFMNDQHDREAGTDQLLNVRLFHHYAGH